MSRSRNRLSTRFFGGYTLPVYGNARIPLNWITSNETVVDETLPGDGHPFQVDKLTWDGQVMSSLNSFWIVDKGTRTESFCINQGLNHLSILGSPTDGNAAVELLALTNPSRPVIDLPVFIAELRDLPMLIKLQGKTLLQKGAGANLSYQFGWAPLISDLKKLLNFQDEVAKREKELKHLFESGLKRTRTLFSGTDQTLPVKTLVNSQGFLSIESMVNKTTVLEVRGHCKWKPDAMPPKTSDDMRRLARNAVLGIDTGVGVLSTAWELVPWSWLVDWTFNIGQYLVSKRNLVGATPYDIQIMRHTVTEEAYRTVTTPASVFCTDGVKRKESKSRVRATPSLSAQLPYLSLKQLSILASISVLKGNAGRIARR